MRKSRNVALNECPPPDDAIFLTQISVMLYTYKMCRKKYDVRQWEAFATDEVEDLVNPKALDLLDKILCYNHEERLTAEKAMEHPYFGELWDKVIQTRRAIYETPVT